MALRTTGFRTGVVDHNIIMSGHRQTMCASQARWRFACNRNAFSCRGQPFERIYARGLQMIRRITLSLIDQNRFALSDFAWAGLLAQCFCGTDTREHATPKMFRRRIILAAASGVPVAICRIKSGLSMSGGQATIQGALWPK